MSHATPSGPLQASMERKLIDAFAPLRLEIVNESHLHAGHHHAESDHHSTFDGSGETHFRVLIVSDRFTGMPRIGRHRAVNDLLADELKAGVHALAIEPNAPGEKTRR